MLVLDFINVGNGDAILVREETRGCRRFAMLVDCGHDSLVRDDHAEPWTPAPSGSTPEISCGPRAWTIWTSCC